MACMRKRRVAPAKPPVRRKKLADPPEDIFADDEREVEIGCCDNDKAGAK